MEAYCWPIGATMHWLREVARRSPGYLTRIGLGSYIDPRQQRGKYTARAPTTWCGCRSWTARNTCSIRAGRSTWRSCGTTSADEHGNLSFEDEPITSCALAMALAVKASGGTVIAAGAASWCRARRPAHAVRIPGVLVDRVVVEPDAMMTTNVRYDDAYLGGQLFDGRASGRLTPGADKVIARRAAQEIRPGEVSIFGFGASSDVPTVMMEGGLFADGGLRRCSCTTEHGPFGGVVMSGWQFSANRYPEALIDGPSRSSTSSTAAAARWRRWPLPQFDRAGNINVSPLRRGQSGAGRLYRHRPQRPQAAVHPAPFTTGGLAAGATGCRLPVGRARGACASSSSAWTRSPPIRWGLATWPSAAGRPRSCRARGLLGGARRPGAGGGCARWPAHQVAGAGPDGVPAGARGGAASAHGPDAVRA
ncbi:hypothetical protein ACTMU2_20770 [Cupriavidus basilensis]